MLKPSAHFIQATGQPSSSTDTSQPVFLSVTGKGEREGLNIPQLASSDLSLQSKLPSHCHRMWMHSPLPQRNANGKHVSTAFVVARCPQYWGHSSEPSGQSGSSSQAHSLGMHRELLQRNISGLQVGVGQSASSLPSSQSCSSSQTKSKETHFPFRHWNWLTAQVFGAEGKPRQRWISYSGLV